MYINFARKQKNIEGESLAYGQQNAENCNITACFGVELLPKKKSNFEKVFVISVKRTRWQ